MNFFKAAITQITKEGECAGTAVLVEEFDTLREAVAVAEGLKISDFSIIEVRSYGFSAAHPYIVVCFGELSQDTGALVYRDASGIKKAVVSAYERALYDDTDWESTMSYTLECMKEGSFEEWEHLKTPVSLLTDSEVNELLQQYGDDRYFVCKDGCLCEVA